MQGSGQPLPLFILVSQNPKFLLGTMWITNGLESKKIKKDEIIPEGWNKGRKMGRN